MKAKHPTLALLVFIVSLPTVGSTYLLLVDCKQDSSTSSSTPTVSVSPANTTVYSEIGKTFTVNITVTNATDLYVWQVGLRFNATLLEALSFEEGPFLKQKGATLWVNATLDNTDGVIHYHASALAGNLTGVNGSGALGTITFKTKSYGNSALQLIDVIPLDSHLTYVDRTLADGMVRIRILGDVNGDMKVDAQDMYGFGQAYGSNSFDPNWNPDCDFNGDRMIDDADLDLLSKNYGKTT